MKIENNYMLKKMDKMSLPARAAFAFMICSILQHGISIISTPIFTRLLTTEQYGVISIFNSWTEIVSVFTTLNLSGGVFTQALIKYNKERDVFSASTAGLATTLSVFVYFIYYVFRIHFNSWMGISTLTMTCIVISSWATLIFDLWASQQRIEYKYKALIALALLVAILKPIVAIIAILLVPSMYKAQARIVSFVAIELLSYIWIFILFLRKGKLFYNRKFWCYLLSLNIPLIPHYLTRTILNQCDRIMIQSMLGYSFAGVYSLAYQLAWMLSIFTNSILQTFNPWMYQRIKKKEYDKIGKISYSLLVIVAGLGLLLISFAPEIIRIFAPKEYYDAIWIIPPVTASVYFLFMYSLFANFEFYFERTKYMAFTSTMGGILNILLNYVFIMKFGYIAAGYTTLACYMFFSIAHYLAMRRIVKEKLENDRIYNIGIIALISFIFLVCAGVLMSTYHFIIIRYVIVLFSTILLIFYRSSFINVYNEIKKK